jgi:hypothetical protein
MNAAIDSRHAQGYSVIFGTKLKVRGRHGLAIAAQYPIFQILKGKDILTDLEFHTVEKRGSSHVGGTNSHFDKGVCHHRIVHINAKRLKRKRNEDGQKSENTKTGTIPPPFICHPTAIFFSVEQTTIPIRTT